MRKFICRLRLNEVSRQQRRRPEPPPDASYTIPRIGSIKLTKLTAHDLQKLYKELMESGRTRGKSGHGNPGLSSTTARSGAVTFRQMPEVPAYMTPLTVPVSGRTRARSPLTVCAAP